MPESKMTDGAEVIGPIKQAIMLEINGMQFYRVAAERCSSPVAREMFEELAKDEVQHRKELEQRFRSVLHGGEWEPPSEPARPSLHFQDPVIDSSLKKDVEGVWFDFAALQIGIMLEKRALDHYRQQGDKSPIPEMRALYSWLTQWEEGHLDRLIAMERALREEIWNDVGFWPMD